MTLQEFETKYNKVSELTLEDVKKLAQDTKMLRAFQEDTDFAIQLVTEIINSNKDESVRAEFIPMKWHYILYNAQITLSKMFSEYSENKDTDLLVTKLNNYLKGNLTSLEKLTAYLVIVSSFNDFDLKEREDDIKETAKSVKEILLNEINPEAAFPLACDIVDMLYNFQTSYYEKYKVDILAESARELNEYVEKLNSVAESIYDGVEESFDVPDNVSPEDLGLIDITKLKDARNNGDEGGEK